MFSRLKIIYFVDRYKFVMVKISANQQQTQIFYQKDQLQPIYLQNSSEQSNQTSNFHISTLKQKPSFLRYASSFIEFANQEDNTKQLEIYQESELINPPSSLIQKYQNLMINHPQENTEKLIKTTQQANLLKAIKIIDIFFEKYSLKLNQKKNLTLSQTLIDNLVFSQTEIICDKEQKLTLSRAFYLMKFSFYQLKKNENIYRNYLPHGAKENKNVCFNQKINQCRHDNRIREMEAIKKEGLYQISGFITFKVLEIESEIFRILKGYQSQKQKLNKIQKILSLLCYRQAFSKMRQFIRQRIQHKEDQKQQVNHCRSKKRQGLSKLKIFSRKRNKQQSVEKKMKQNQNNQKNTDFSTSQQQHSNQRIITSQIFGQVDFNELQCNQNGCQEDLLTKKQVEFRNRMRKKPNNNNNKSQSQAETLNSLRSLQSQQYQFLGQKIASRDIETFRNISSSKNLLSCQLKLEEYDAPTLKMIDYDGGVGEKRKFNVIGNKLLKNKDCLIKQAQKVQLIDMKERRYLNVRTNLFQLPIQNDLKSCRTEEEMTRIYHLKPDGLIRNQILFEQNQDFITQLQSTKLPTLSTNKWKINCLQQNLHKIQNTNRQFYQINNTKTLKPKNKTKNQLENYYFNQQIQKIRNNNDHKQYTQNSNNNYNNNNSNNNRKLLIKKNNPITHQQQIHASTNRFGDKYKKQENMEPKKVKIIKSLSPKLRLSMNSSYGKLGSGIEINNNKNFQTCSNLSDNSSKMSGQIKSNFLPSQAQSLIYPQNNIHHFRPVNVLYGVNFQHTQSQSALKIIMKSPSQLLCLLQNNGSPQYDMPENTRRENHLIAHANNNTIHQHNQLIRGSSKTVCFNNQYQSNHIIRHENKVKFQSPRAQRQRFSQYQLQSQKFRQQVAHCRPSSMSSAHSNNRSQYNILIGSPNNKMVKNEYKIQSIQPGANNNSKKRGLNVVARNTPSYKTINLLTQSQQHMRQKSLSYFPTVIK